jgi:ribosome maturation factor RimP
MSTVQAEIEERLAVAEPDVEVLLAEEVGGGTLRVFIDHPAGVSLELCERVTRHLNELRTERALEVSSPGPERPLTRPEHFRRFLGRRARIRTGAGKVTGELVTAGDADVTVSAPDGILSIPYAEIRRSNLVGD